MTTKTNNSHAKEKEQKKAKILDDVKPGKFFYQFLVMISITNSYFAGKRLSFLEEFIDYFISLIKDKDQVNGVKRILINEFGEWLEPYWQESYTPYRHHEVDSSSKGRILIEAHKWSRIMADEFSLFVIEKQEDDRGM